MYDAYISRSRCIDSAREGGADLSTGKKAELQKPLGLRPRGRGGFKLNRMNHTAMSIGLRPRGRGGFKQMQKKAEEIKERLRPRGRGGFKLQYQFKGVHQF